MSNVIDLTQTKAAKERGIGIAAFLNAQTLGLTATQCAAAMRKAREIYARGVRSPARVVADVRRESYELANFGAA